MSNQKESQTEGKTEEAELQVMDDLLVEGDNLIAKLKEHDLAVDFITEAALNLLSLADYDLIINHLQHNRDLHDDLEEAE